LWLLLLLQPWLSLTHLVQCQQQTHLQRPGSSPRPACGRLPQQRWCGATGADAAALVARAAAVAAAAKDATGVAPVAAAAAKDAGDASCCC